MTTGERIKSLRLRLDMNADQLAEKVGVNRATIYRYEKGDIENMSIEVLKPLAAALRTTPAWLMGWGEDSDENDATFQKPDAHDSKEEELLAYYRQLNSDGQDKLIDYASDLVAGGRYKKDAGCDIPGIVEKEA